MQASDPGEGWAWLDPQPPSREIEPELCRSFATCFATPQGETVLAHLRRTFLDRRLPPSASDAELRHVEGQRFVVAYLLKLAERGRKGTIGRLRTTKEADRT